MAWRVDVRIRPDRTVHVWPDPDLITHDLTGAACVCGPRLEEQGDGVLVVHHSLAEET